MAEYKIYCATHKPSNTKYIGLTKVPLLKRIGQHFSLTAYKRGAFQKFIHTTQYEDWTWEVLFTLEDSKKAHQLETDVIKDYLARGENLMNVKSNSQTYENFESSQLDPFRYKKGSEPWNKGKSNVYSEETIQKMRIGKLRNPTRTPPSAETIAKIKSTQGKAIECIETGEKFQSIGEAALHFNVARSGIRKVLNGQAGYVAGLTFKFTTKEVPLG